MASHIVSLPQPGRVPPPIPRPPPAPGPPPPRRPRAAGPAAGGCRMWPYATTAEAVCDVLRLSRGMSYKNALAGVPFGGGKAVIIGESRKAKTPELFEAFGRLVDSLGGRYVTAEDVGTTSADMASVARATRQVAGLGRAPGEAG